MTDDLELTEAQKLILAEVVEPPFSYLELNVLDAHSLASAIITLQAQVDRAEFRAKHYEYTGFVTGTVCEVCDNEEKGSDPRHDYTPADWLREAKKKLESTK